MKNEILGRLYGQSYSLDEEGKMCQYLVCLLVDAKEGGLLVELLGHEII